MTSPYDDPIDELATPYDDAMRTDPDIEPPDDEFADDEVELVEDPDLIAARGLGHESDSLVTDELRPEDEVLEADPPDEPSTPTDHQITVDDMRHGETIEDRLAQEEPDIQP